MTDPHTMLTVQYPLLSNTRRALATMLVGASLTVGLQSGAWAQAAPARAAKPAAQMIDSIAAVVNDDVITRRELSERIDMVEKRMKAQKVAVPARADFERQMLERMIVDRTQIQLAKETGIRVDDAFVDRAVARIAEQNKMSLQEFRNQIEREGTPYPRFREEIRDEITMQRVREREVDNKVQVNDSEVDNFLAVQADSTQGGQEINLAQVLVRIPENASAEQVAARLARAEQARQQLKTGADFAKIAATYSDAPEALRGGDLGWRSQERLPQMFSDAIGKLKPGEVSPVIRSGNGFHILKLVGKRDASATNAAAAVQQTHARHILIKVNQVVSAADAKRKLIDLKLRLDNKAATFAELAKLYSNDLSAGKGGDLGWLYPGDTVPEFEQAMNGLKPGQVSEPVESPFGYHLIEVIERKTDDVSKERKRLAARQAIRERKIDEATQAWQSELRDRAYVEYRNQDQ